MIERVTTILGRRTVLIPALVVVFAALLLARRGDTLLVPGVWAEDGAVIVPSILRDGLATLAEPVNGYLVTVPKLIDLAAAISPSHFPLINAALAWAFAIAVGVAVAVAPTILRYRPLAAIAVFVIPTDPEVFGIGLYTLWWSGILVILVALWRPEARGVVLRVVIVVVAGLSSPVVLAVLPLLLARAVVWRRRREIVVASVAVLVSVVQGAFLVRRALEGADESRFASPQSTVPTFFGNYLIGSWTDARLALVVAGALFVAGLLAAALAVRTRWRTYAVFAYLLVVTIGMTVSRTGDNVIDPYTSGPRYFFFPFIVLSWTMLWLVAVARPRWLVAVPAAVLVLATANSWPEWGGRNDDLAWNLNLASCARSESYRFPMQYEGDASQPWYVEISGADCRDWSARDPIPAPDIPTLPYQVAGPAEAPATTTLVDGHGSVEFALGPGDALELQTSRYTDTIRLLITGADGFSTVLVPASSWSEFVFDDPGLPDRFEVVIDGGGPDQWVAVGVRPAG